MNFRASRPSTHFAGKVIAGDDVAAGVQISGAAVTPVVEAVGDATDISLIVKGKGAGTVNITSPISLTGAETITVAGIAATSTDGLVVTNTTPATALVPVQRSPRIRLHANVWNTTATAATNTSDWEIEAAPVSSTAPTGRLLFGYSSNGGAYTFPMIVDGVGNLTIVGPSGVSMPNAASVTFGTRGYITGGGTDGSFLLRVSDVTAGVALDVAGVDGTLTVRQRSGGSTFGHVSAASVRGTAVAFASLPAAPVEGMLVGVTNSNTAIWGATIAGGGTDHVLAYYNGTNWTVAGK